MWRFYHHAVKESQAGTTGALISYTYCLHEMVCTYTDSAKMVVHFHKGHLENTPTPPLPEWIFIDSWYWRSFGKENKIKIKVHPRWHNWCDAAFTQEGSVGPWFSWVFVCRVDVVVDVSDSLSVIYRLFCCKKKKFELTLKWKYFFKHFLVQESWSLSMKMKILFAHQQWRKGEATHKERKHLWSKSYQKTLNLFFIFKFDSEIIL